MKLRLLLGGLALAVACAGPAAADETIKIGFITKFPVPFFATMEDAAKAYAKANPGVEIEFGQGTSATDIEGQIALIESMVTKGVQGIAITPVDPTVAPALDKAIAKGVKVVLMDNNIPDWNGRTALATTNNYNAGKIAGDCWSQHRWSPLSCSWPAQRASTSSTARSSSLPTMPVTSHSSAITAHSLALTPSPPIWRRCATPNGSSTPSDPSPGPRRCWPTCPAIHTASPFPTAD